MVGSSHSLGSRAPAMNDRRAMASRVPSSPEAAQHAPHCLSLNSKAAWSHLRVWLPLCVTVPQILLTEEAISMACKIGGKTFISSKHLWVSNGLLGASQRLGAKTIPWFEKPAKCLQGFFEPLCMESQMLIKYLSSHDLEQSWKIEPQGNWKQLLLSTLGDRCWDLISAVWGSSWNRVGALAVDAWDGLYSSWIQGIHGKTFLAVGFAFTEVTPIFVKKWKPFAKHYFSSKL